MACRRDESAIAVLTVQEVTVGIDNTEIERLGQVEQVFTVCASMSPAIDVETGDAIDGPGDAKIPINKAEYIEAVLASTDRKLYSLIPPSLDRARSLLILDRIRSVQAETNALTTGGQYRDENTPVVAVDD